MEEELLRLRVRLETKSRQLLSKNVEIKEIKSKIKDLEFKINNKNQLKLF